MALSGTIADWSFADILQVIATQRKSGTLRLDCSSETVSFTVHEGALVEAERKQPGRTSGFLRFLVETGRVAPAGARQIIELMQEGDHDPISTVERAGLIQGDRLQSAFHAFVQELIYGVLQWTQGDYEFIAHAVTPKHETLKLKPEGLLIEGMRRIDEWVRIAHVVQPQTVFRAVATSPVASDIPKRERALMRLIDGVQDVESLSRMAPLTQFEVGEALLNLHQWSLIAVCDEDAGLLVVDLGVDDLEEESRLVRVVRVASLALLVLASIVFGLVTGDSDWAAPSADRERARHYQTVRFALDLYQIERGRYPETLHELDVVGIDIGAAGRDLVYRPLDRGVAYSLIDDIPPDAWHLRLAALWKGLSGSPTAPDDS